MQILSNSPKISRNGTRRFVTLSAALILSFCILSLVSVNDVRARGLKGIGLTGPSQFPWSQFYVGADAFPVMIAINQRKNQHRIRIPRYHFQTRKCTCEQLFRWGEYTAA